MAIKLEVGKRYVDREGRVYGPLFAASDASYPFECRVRNESWTADGRYYRVETEASSWDLIALAPDEALSGEAALDALTELDHLRARVAELTEQNCDLAQSTDAMLAERAKGRGQ